METTRWRDFELSRMMLGSVQWGMPYGVANRTGQPSYREVVSILGEAYENGVNCIDTASDYGESEEVIGRALDELGLHDRFTIVTKVLPLSEEELQDSHRARAKIEQSIERSRKRLKCDLLPLVLFHRDSDARFLDVLEDLKNRQWIGEIGVSCGHDPGVARTHLKNWSVSAMQIPGNLFDRRHFSGGTVAEAKTSGRALFLRSVYLQGILALPTSLIPDHLKGLEVAHRHMTEYASTHAMSLAELALRSMLSNSAITSILVGIETLSQLRENLSYFGRGPLPHEVIQELESKELQLSESMISPYLWRR